MGVFNKLLDYLKDDDDDDDDYDPDDYDEYEEELRRKEEKERKAAEAKKRKEEAKREAREAKAARAAAKAAEEPDDGDDSEEEMRPAKSSGGFMNKIRNFLSSEDEDEEPDDEEFLEENEDEEEAPRRSAARSDYQRTGKRSILPQDTHKPVINRKTTYSQQAQTGVTANYNNRPEPETKAPVRRSQSAPVNREVPFRERPVREQAASNLEVNIIKPTSFEECQDICDTLLAGKPIIVNLEGFNDLLVGQRIMDFVSGCVYSINGKLHQISGYIFIISPDGVDISGDYLALMKENDFGVPTFYKKN